MFRLDGLKVAVHGGWGEIGGNQIVLEAPEGSVLLDFGRSFSRWNRHFTEFLTPRSGLGLRDLLALGLLPPYRGLYREGEADTLFPGELERSFLQPHLEGEKVRALLLSHAHLDHTGAVAYLRENLPVVSTASTAAILKAMQDTAQVGLEAEAAYLTPRRPNGQGLLEAQPRGPYQRRPYHLLGGELKEIASLSPSKSKPLEGHPWQAATEPLSLGPFRVWAYPVDHSVPGAAAFVLETPAGRVVYTGDLRFHGQQGRQTKALVETLEKHETTLLIVEGTRLGRSGQTYTEAQVQAALCEAIRQHPSGPIAVDFAPRNLERLRACLEAGREAGRTLVITPKDAYLLYSLAEAEPTWRDTLEQCRVLQEPRSRSTQWAEHLWAQAPVKAVEMTEIARQPEAFVLAFGFFEVNRLLDLRLLSGFKAQGLYIFSNSYWADDEQILDLQVLLNWLNRLNFRLLPAGLQALPKDPSTVDNPYHTSGHAPQQHLLELAQRLKPRYRLPVHTEQPQLWENQLPGTKVLLKK
ncbi:MAG: MBL fold metallo-hydrolase [Meiothermus sp.]|nr:MBL fold metallo-hydrolase [Meiothermus sp.]